jgi:hypothetical protein
LHDREGFGPVSRGKSLRDHGRIAIRKGSKPGNAAQAGLTQLPPQGQQRVWWPTSPQATVRTANDGAFSKPARYCETRSHLQSIMKLSAALNQVKPDVHLNRAR